MENRYVDANELLLKSFNRTFMQGDYVTHFLREDIEDPHFTTERIYQIIGLSKDLDDKSNNKRVVVIALSGDKPIYTIPLNDFMKEIDKTEFPGYKQTYVFERISEDEVMRISKGILV